MEPADVLSRCRGIVVDAGYDPDTLTQNPLDFFDFVRDCIQAWPRKKADNTPWFKDFAVGLRRLRDNYEAEVQSDPLMLYQPAHKVSLEFHKSTAHIRYYRAGNRSSKTQSGVADNYWVMTGQHPYRKMPPLPCAVAVIGVNFSKYAPTVFETKYLYGENGNPLSPVFPEGGKWFYKYNEKKHIIYVCCPECAKQKKAASCKHPKSSVILFADGEGPSVLQGGQYAQVQFDEQIREDFLGEALKRTETVPHAGIIVTETPLHGRAWWTHTILTRDANAGVRIGDSGAPLVSLHTIDQFAAGMTSHELIRASMQLMPAAEIEARVWGRPAAFKETGVFDSGEITLMLETATLPTRGDLWFVAELKGEPLTDVLHRLEPGMPVEFHGRDEGFLRVWEQPQPDTQYIIGGDVAQGLSKRDPSCATVLEMSIKGFDIYFRQVAQLHGWLNPKTYAEELTKLALWYNEALVVVERNGPGAETLRNIKEWGYWNMFVDMSDPAQAHFTLDPLLGVNTDRSSKPVMVGCLQQVIKDRRTGKRSIDIPCADTLDELGLFVQELAAAGQSYKFQAATGMTDDRVMSLVVAVYAAKAFGVYDFGKDVLRQKKQAAEKISAQERAVWAELHKQLGEDARE